MKVCTAYLPFAQSEHVLALAAPSVADTLPPAHLVHPVMPVPALVVL
jgi:hypothetical protein